MNNRQLERFEVAADGLGRFIIDVSLPPGYEAGDAAYPVIVVTDGHILFDIAQVVVHGGFAREQTMLPPSIVVGVGHPADEGSASWYGRRNFEFTEPWAMDDALGMLLRQIHGMMKAKEGKPELELQAGGYARFMAFLRDELLPLLGRRYRVDATARHTLIGDSSGGYFAMRATYDPSSPFRRYLCVSPTMGLAPGSLEAAEAAFAAQATDHDVDVFVCCGKVEVDQSMMTALCRFGSAVMWMAERFALRQWPNARLEWEVMNHEDHASIAARAIAAGLRSVHRVRPGVHDAEIARQMAARLAALSGG